jgi:hypothetical protein
MPFKVSYIIQFTINLLIKLYFELIKLFNYKKKRIYVFSDSRGFYLNKWFCKKNPLLSYIDMLSNTYRVDYSLCNYRHTTLLDFLCDYEEHIRHNKYEAIILHLGVVDFSPRKASQAKAILKHKKIRLEKVFGSSTIGNLSIEPYQEYYEGEPTASIYTINFLRDFIIDKINRIETKIIWIGVNKVLTYWDGNYSNKRPDNMNQILNYQQIIDQHFTGDNISLSNLTDDEIKLYTVDNIHLSIEGFRYLYNLVVKKVTP